MTSVYLFRKTYVKTAYSSQVLCELTPYWWTLTWVIHVYQPSSKRPHFFYALRWCGFSTTCPCEKRHLHCPNFLARQAKFALWRLKFLINQLSQKGLLDFLDSWYFLRLQAICPELNVPIPFLREPVMIEDKLVIICGKELWKIYMGFCVLLNIGVPYLFPC